MISFARGKQICRRTHHDIWVCLILTTLILAVYSQVIRYDFISLDDMTYVTANRHVKSGISPEGFLWSFRTTDCGNWHPLTWLSHMMDVECYGLHAGSHHLTNVLLHIVNTLLLFFLLRSMTGALRPSVFVAALFALHPLHVESIAWISERKDVLSTFFGLLTLISYMRYARQQSRSGYMLALLFFMFGLMAKPMLVTLPFVLLLLDYWPLRRLRFNGLFRKASIDPNRSLSPLLKEKIPFFILTMASCLVTVYAQQAGDSVASLDVYPMGLRIGNALVAYVGYLAKMIWPIHLAGFYPHPTFLPAWQVAGSALLLMAVFIVCGLTTRRRPYLIVGWLMYIGMLLPVIGIVQVGDQAMADRYTYVPLIGIFVILAWGLPELFEKWHIRKVGFVICAALFLPMLMITTWLQVRHWSDNISFYEHMIKVTDNNFMAHYNLGVYLAEHEQIDAAITQYQKALSIKPGHADANNNLGNALVIKGRYKEAIPYYTNALDRVPDDPEINNNLGVALIHAKKNEQAIRHFKLALKLRPDYIEAQQNLKKALGR